LQCAALKAMSCPIRQPSRERSRGAGNELPTQPARLRHPLACVLRST
jgi:hypothetical protein